MRALDLYASTGVGFADAYLLPSTELSEADAVMSFDRGLDGVAAIRRIEP